MRFAAHLSERVLDAAPGLAASQNALLDALGIERPAYPRDVEALLDAMHADKKARGGTVRFALLAEPGAYRAVPVGDEALARELQLWMDETNERG